jgi:hypothetical protein
MCQFARSNNKKNFCYILLLLKQNFVLLNFLEYVVMTFQYSKKLPADLMVSAENLQKFITL